MSMGKPRGKGSARENSVMAKIACSLMLLLCLSVSAQTQPSGLEGTVTDTEGAVIERARIFVHWDPTGSIVGLHTNVGIRHDVEIETGRNGKFRVDVPAGFYDVFISADAFSPHAEKIRVSPASRVTMNRRLPADPLVGKELGDSFPTK
jgi:hypothetical protein